MSDEELRDSRDRLALKDWSATWQFWDEQLRYREAKRVNDQMLKFTQTIHRLTWVLTVLTIISVGAAIVAIWIALAH